MTFKVIQSFKLKGIVQEIDSVIDLPEQAAVNLHGYIQPVTFNQCHPPTSGGRCNTTTFEQSGDPVSCPYFYRVCWAVQKYQQHCTRNTGCLTFKFLKRQDEVAAPEIVKEREAATETVKRYLAGGTNA